LFRAGGSTYSYYLECRADAYVALLVEDERAVLHAARVEEADVAGAGQLLGRATGVVVGGWDAADGADDVEVVGYEGFVGDEEEQGEVFKDGDLADLGVADNLVWGAYVS
jgi:hypothetical protein